MNLMKPPEQPPQRSYPEPGTPLTPRELQVAALVAQGLPNVKIAKRLGISPHTAHFHVGNILTKLNVDRRTGIAAFAVREGLA